MHRIDGKKFKKTNCLPVFWPTATNVKCPTFFFESAPVRVQS